MRRRVPSRGRIAARQDFPELPFACPCGLPLSSRQHRRKAVVRQFAWDERDLAWGERRKGGCYHKRGDRRNGEAMEHNEEERKEKQNPGFEALPPRISAIEQQLTQAAGRLTSVPMSDRRCWSALARAARKSQALLRKVSELRLPGEWLSSRQRSQSDGRWIALAEALGESRSLWSDLKDYVRYAPRPPAHLQRAHEPLNPQRIREVRDGL